MKQDLIYWLTYHAFVSLFLVPGVWGGGWLCQVSSLTSSQWGQTSNCWHRRQGGNTHLGGQDCRSKATGAQRGCAISCLGDAHNFTAQAPEQAEITLKSTLLWKGGWTRTSRSPLQPKMSSIKPGSTPAQGGCTGVLHTLPIPQN